MEQTIMNPDQYFTAHSLDAPFCKERLGWSWDDKKITIPIYDIEGKLLFCRYRHFTGEAKFTSDEGSHPTLYCSHLIKENPTIILCEGEPDCARLLQEEVPAVSSTSGVKTVTDKMLKPLEGKNVYILLDNDEAGKSSIDKYHSLLPTAKIILIPNPYKDVSEYLTDGHNKEDILKMIETAITYEDWQELSEPNEFALEEATTLLKENLPEEEWIIDRVLPSEGFTFIVGGEATGKSFYTLTIAKSVTTGEDWLKHFQIKKKVKVLFLDKENTRRRTQSRMEGLHMTGEDIYRVRFPHYFNLTDPDEEDGYSAFAKSLSRKVKKLGIGLLVIDSFTDIMVGNENASADTQSFFDGMRQLFPNISILVLHHASKPSAGTPRSSAQRARGSTNIMAQVYSAFHVEGVPRSKNEFTIEQTKAGDSEKLNKFKVRLVSIPSWKDVNKTVVDKIEYMGEVYDQEMKLDTAKEIIEESFKNSEVLTRKELIDICEGESVSEATVRRAIKEMLEENILECIVDEKDKRSVKYSWV